MNDQTAGAEHGSAPPAKLPVYKNGQRNEMHERLDALAGEWSVAVEISYLGRKFDVPMKAAQVCRRHWLEGLGDRFLQDITQDETGKTNYYRLGILGYSVMDERYEWNTVDAMNANMMTYKGARGSGKMAGEISMTGEFIDQGILGDEYIGKNIAARTVIGIEMANRHIIELYLTPPGEPEVLVSRGIYTR